MLSCEIFLLCSLFAILYGRRTKKDFEESINSFCHNIHKTPRNTVFWHHPFMVSKILFIECHGVTFDDDWCELFLSKQDTVRSRCYFGTGFDHGQTDCDNKTNKNCFWKQEHSNIQISQFELIINEQSREVIGQNGTTRLKIQLQLSLPNLAHRSHSPLSINHRLPQKSDLENHNGLRHEWNHPNTSTK